jgi:hypothetical protein
MVLSGYFVLVRPMLEAIVCSCLQTASLVSLVKARPGFSSKCSWSRRSVRLLLPMHRVLVQRLELRRVQIARVRGTDSQGDYCSLYIDC